MIVYNKYSVNGTKALAECSYCHAVAKKELDAATGQWETGEFIERGEKGYDFIIYNSDNNPVSHGICNPCLEREIENFTDRRAKQAEKLRERVEERRSPGK